jgi:hypothetical protein
MAARRKAQAPTDAPTLLRACDAAHSLALELSGVQAIAQALHEVHFSPSSVGGPAALGWVERVFLEWLDESTETVTRQADTLSAQLDQLRALPPGEAA